MTKKNLKREEDRLTHKTGLKPKTVKLLEVTQENLNSVLLELKKDKSLFDLNIRNIISFMLKTYKDKGEILAKLKILKTRENEEEEVVDSIFRIILSILGYKTDCLQKAVVTVSGEIYPLSRRLSLWYFKNKGMEEKEVDFYLEELERIIFKTGRINFIVGEEEDEEEMDERMDEKEEHESSSHDTSSSLSEHKQEEIAQPLDLKVLTDSEEMDRLDKALGIIFKDKQPPLTTSDKQRIAKVLDVIEVILEQNPVTNLIHFRRLLGLVDIDDLLFKKVFRVLKHLTKKYPDEQLDSLYAFYVDALHKYRNISRTIDTMQEYFKGLFKWSDVFRASSANDQLDLNIVDRSKINKEEFYAYCLSEQVYLWKIQGLLLYFVRKEDDVKVLETFRDLVNKIEFSDEKLSVIESINNRIKLMHK